MKKDLFCVENISTAATCVGGLVGIIGGLTITGEPPASASLPTYLTYPLIAAAFGYLTALGTYVSFFAPPQDVSPDKPYTKR